MNVDVQLFARARELAGSPHVTVELPEGSSVADLKLALGEHSPNLRPLLSQLLVAIGTDYATDETPIITGAEIACFPPVSGG